MLTVEEDERLDYLLSLRRPWSPQEAAEALGLLREASSRRVETVRVVGDVL